MKKEKKDKPKILCENCGIRFVQERKWQRFCSLKCKWDKWDRLHPRVRKADGL